MEYSKMSAFDPTTFLEATQTETNERRIPLPVDNPSSEDGCYLAVVGEITSKSGTIGKGDKIGQPWMSVVVPLKLELSQQVQDLVKYQSFTLSDNVFLDLTPDGSAIDNAPGKNRGQKAYRDALGKNKPGESFSWKRDVQGQVLKVKLRHEMYEGFPQERVAVIMKA
jgi:hypothetical protein